MVMDTAQEATQVAIQEVTQEATLEALDQATLDREVTQDPQPTPTRMTTCTNAVVTQVVMEVMASGTLTTPVVTELSQQRNAK